MKTILSIVLLLTFSIAKEHHLVDFTSANNGLMTASALVGDDVHVKLPENPTTGFTWHVIQRSSADEKGLKFDGDKYFKPKSSKDEKPVFGRGGFRMMRFSAHEAGTYSVEVVKAKGWQLEKYMDDKGFLRTSDLDNI